MEDVYIYYQDKDRARAREGITPRKLVNTPTKIGNLANFFESIVRLFRLRRKSTQGADLSIEAWHLLYKSEARKPPHTKPPKILRYTNVFM